MGWHDETHEEVRDSRSDGTAERGGLGCSGERSGAVSGAGVTPVHSVDVTRVLLPLRSGTRVVLNRNEMQVTRRSGWSRGYG